tara:strand:- start:448 stop:633 length:186 start_codon:yes stop_codon:yes gene_type:complete
MEIKVKVKNVFGNELIYPMCETSKVFSNIAKTKTLSIQVLVSLKSIGYSITEIKDDTILSI